MNQIQEKTKLIREVITGTALCVVILFISIYLPLLGFFMALIMPLPILYFRLKLGRKPGVFIMLAVFAASCAAVSGFSDGINGASAPQNSAMLFSIDILFYAALLLAGFFIGEFLEIRLSIGRVFIYTLALTIGLCTAIFFLYTSYTGNGIVSLISEYIAANIKLTLSLYENMGMDHENINLISNSFAAIQYVLLRIIPSLVISMLSFVIWVNLLFIKKILIKKEIYLKSLMNLNLWKAPDHIVWAVILMIIFILLPFKNIKIIALNSIIIFMLVYFFQGIAIISFILEKKKLPIFLKVTIYGIVAIQQILVFVIILLGFFDTWMDFRKIDVNNISNDSDGYT